MARVEISYRNFIHFKEKKYYFLHSSLRGISVRILQFVWGSKQKLPSNPIFLLVEQILITLKTINRTSPLPTSRESTSRPMMWHTKIGVIWKKSILSQHTTSGKSDIMGNQPAIFEENRVFAQKPRLCPLQGFDSCQSLQSYLARNVERLTKSD